MPQIASLLDGKKWRIFNTLAYLHLRYFIFKPNMLNDISTHRSLIKLKIPSADVPFANAWNRKLSSVFSALGSPYVACMKRSFFIALLVDSGLEAELVLGVVPGNIKVGHAWVVDNAGAVLAEHYNPEEFDYRVIKRYAIK